MQASKNHEISASIRGLYDHQPMQEIDTYYLSHFQISPNNMCPENSSHGASNLSFRHHSYKENFFTLDSTPPIASHFVVCESSSNGSVLSDMSPISPQEGSQTCSSDPQPFSDPTYGSPISGCSVADEGNELKNKLREIEISLLGPEMNVNDGCYCSYRNCTHQATSNANWDWNQIQEVIPSWTLKEVLIKCANAVYEVDFSTATFFIQVLERMVSVSGDPAQRLGAYLLEGLRARLERSGSSIYKALKCEEPTGPELMSYMSILYVACPYWQFAYTSANVVIKEAMENESQIHIIDFQIAQGSQWALLIPELANRCGGPPAIRITGVDDSQSARARGGGLEMVGRRLSDIAKSHGVHFEFHAAPMFGFRVEQHHLGLRPGEAVAVNFPYVLHHMPDESVSTDNHRDRLLQLVKSLSPKVVTLGEQESNTNTSPFMLRFHEMLEYYTAMFESIDAGSTKDERQRIKAEQNCVARDIVNMIACEGSERVERHEPFVKWRFRLMSAGFSPCPLSCKAREAVWKLMSTFSNKYWVQEREGAFYLGWMNRAMATSSAWR